MPFTTHAGPNAGPNEQQNTDHGGVVVEVPAATNGRWVAVDLDELLEGLELAGGPGELICTYLDAGGRRRYIERRPPRKQRSGHRGVAP
jgi:hypothetical protein